MYKKIEISKTNNDQPLLHYETNEIKIEKKLDDEEYLKIFEKFNPTIGFSLPDRLVQDFITDGSVIPSFKRSGLFTNEDFDKLVETFRNNYEIKPKKKKKKPYKQTKKKIKKKKKIAKKAKSLIKKKNNTKKVHGKKKNK